MVLNVAQALASRIIPYDYAWHILAGLVAFTALRIFSQGRTTNRERDLHNRTFLVTGGFTALGLTLLQQLAQRGAKVIALTGDPVDSATITTLVTLLRTSYSNQTIYAEQCNLSDPDSVRAFCTRFLMQGAADNSKTKTDTRLDGILFAHEYQHIGVPRLFRRIAIDEEKQKRESNSLSTFLITTLLLPALLVAPPERDIRIINVVNPFYAAAAASLRTFNVFDPSFTHFTTSSSSPPSKSSFLDEGFRSLRTVILTRHLQRILDALPNPQVPKTQGGTSSVPVVSARVQRSNIVAVCVSPGLSRVDTLSRMLNADWNLLDGSTPQQGSVERTFSWLGVLLYILLLPLLHISTKSPKAAIQSILHALFLPTPFKVLSSSLSSDDATPSASQKGNTAADSVPIPTAAPHRPPNLIHEEILKPGALYAECAVVNLDIVLPAEPTANQDEASSKDQIADDREYGGEVVGRRVWEAYEAALKVWDKGGVRE